MLVSYHLEWGRHGIKMNLVGKWKHYQQKRSNGQQRGVQKMIEKYGMQLRSAYPAQGVQTGIENSPVSKVAGQYSS